MNKKSYITFSIASILIGVLAMGAIVSPIVISNIANKKVKITDTNNDAILNTTGFNSVNISLNTNEYSGIKYEINNSKLYLSAPQTLNNKIFCGWFIKDNDTPISHLNNDYLSYDLVKEYIEENSLSIIAVYDAGHNINYDTNGGSFSAPPINIYTTKYKNYILPSDVHKEGYKFTGWTTEFGNFLTELNSIYDYDISLHAEYIPMEDTSFINNSFSFCSGFGRYSNVTRDDLIRDYSYYSENYSITFNEDGTAELFYLTPSQKINYAEFALDTFIYNWLSKIAYLTTEQTYITKVDKYLVEGAFNDVKTLFPAEDYKSMVWKQEDGIVKVTLKDNLKYRINNLWEKIDEKVPTLEAMDNLINDITIPSNYLSNDLFREFDFIFSDNKLTYLDKYNGIITYRYASSKQINNYDLIETLSDDSESINIHFLDQIITTQYLKVNYVTCKYRDTSLENVPLLHYDSLLTTRFNVAFSENELRNPSYGWSQFVFSNNEEYYFTNVNVSKISLTSYGYFFSFDYDSSLDSVIFSVTETGFIKELIRFISEQEDYEDIEDYSAHIDLSGISEYTWWL